MGVMLYRMEPRRVPICRIRAKVAKTVAGRSARSRSLYIGDGQASAWRRRRHPGSVSGFLDGAHPPAHPRRRSRRSRGIRPHASHVCTERVHPKAWRGGAASAAAGLAPSFSPAFAGRVSMLVERLRQHSAMSSLGARKIRSFHGSLHARAASSRAALQFATAWLRSARGSSDEPEREALGLLGLNRRLQTGALALSAPNLHAPNREHQGLGALSTSASPGTGSQVSRELEAQVCSEPPSEVEARASRPESEEPAFTL